MGEQLSEGGVMRDRTRDLIERTVGLSKVCAVSGGINISNVSLLEALLDAVRAEERANLFAVGEPFQMMESSEGPHPESGEVERLRTCLRNIQIEYEREGSKPHHLKRVVAIQCRVGLSASPPPLEGAGRCEDGSSRGLGGHPCGERDQSNVSATASLATDWRSAPRGVPLLLRHRAGYTGLGILSDQSFGDNSFTTASVAWAGKRPGDPPGVWMTADEANIVSWSLANGALGRQDEVVQPIRDEPISSSKGEALPVVSEEMVEAAARKIGDEVGLHMFDDMALDRAELRKMVRSADGYEVTEPTQPAPPSPPPYPSPVPASDKGEEPTAWRGRFRTKWAVNSWSYSDGPEKPPWEPWNGERGHDLEPLYARPSTGVSREEVEALAGALTMCADFIVELGASGLAILEGITPAGRAALTEDKANA